MKTSIFKCLIILFFAISVMPDIFAQDKKSENSKVQRCLTMEYLENQIKADPTLPAKWKAQGELIQKQNLQNKVLQEQSVTIIPVVFHLVITAGQQATVTDALIQRQIDILNRDFAGLNPDSSKLPAAFKAVFGHSQIRFCLAKRTPGNVATNGIERRVTNATFTSNSLTDLKKFAGGGLDQWDGNKYLNIWAANFSDNVLGISTFPFTQPADEQGVCIHWGTLDLACASPFINVYDAGRTLVHEVGHYFYLYHIWGDDNGACTGNDFRIQDGYPLPGSCTDDTPNQANATGSCLSGVQTDACSASAPGFMYQNYMDYTNDACYGMFTIAQACRMQGCLDNYRASLKTSNGCTPVVPVNNDVRVSEILNPVSRGFSCGAKTTYCDLQLITPQVLIVNDGDAPLTSFTFTIKIDGNIIATQDWIGNLSPAEFAYVNIDAFLPTTGLHTLSISTSNPNGGIDSRPDNDFADAAYTIVPSALNPPMAVESFEAAFPPLGWRVVNPDNSITWVKTLVAGNPGAASARLNSYLYNSLSQKDYLISPKIKTAGVDSFILNFNIAYAKYSDDIADWDELEIVYSEDCGTTWKPTGYKKSGDALATNGGVVTGDVSFVPTLAQWRAETVKLSLCQITSPEIVFAFKSTNKYGNNIYIDNVSINKVDGFTNNAGLSDLSSPVNMICDGSGKVTPIFTLLNNGIDPLTAVSFHISIDGGTATLNNWTGNLARCGKEQITLPAIDVPVSGKHSFLIYTTNPNGVADQFTGNDTLKSDFILVNTVTAPLVEGFENNTFPPAGFIVQNPDNNITWERTTAAAQTGVSAMVIKNYNYAINNTTDILITPRVTIGTIDSAFISFDYAYNTGVNNSDTLEILVSKNCGLTTTTVWKKWGENLQTIDDPDFPKNIEFIPAKNQWRNARINISDIVGSNDQIQVYFTAKSNKQNNLYVDNINVFGKTLPQLLKDQGYLIYPNPFTSTFLIQHYNTPVNLQSVQLFNTRGELVWDKRFAGNANAQISINAGKLAAGVYILKMIYSDKTIIERVVKN